MKLKTLKELEITLPPRTRARTFEAIKKEAIKWVKKLKNVRCEALIKFCNITEEDLK